MRRADSVAADGLTVEVRLPITDVAKADVFDHLEAGHSPDDGRVVALSDLRADLADAAEEDAAAQLNALVEAELQKARVRAEVQAVLTQEKADAAFRAPTSHGTLDHLLLQPREPLTYTIDRLHPKGSNTLIAAQFKVGKTTLMANLLRSWADGEPFLGTFPVEPGPGRIGLFNYELTADMLLDDYLKPLGVSHPERIAVANLRGLNLDLRSQSAFDWAVNWLKDHDCDALVIDPFGAAARLANENDNSEARNWLLGTLDTLKQDAGITDLWMPAHTGRTEKESGAEHARGASSVDDWADVRWLYTNGRVTDEEGAMVHGRYFRAHGRGVDVSERQVLFDPDDKFLHVGDLRPKAVVALFSAAKQAVAKARDLTNAEGVGPKAGELQAAMKGDTAVIKKGIKQAIDCGWLAVTPGPNNAKFHTPTAEGLSALGLA